MRSPTPLTARIGANASGGVVGGSRRRCRRRPAGCRSIQESSFSSHSDDVAADQREALGRAPTCSPIVPPLPRRTRASRPSTVIEMPAPAMLANSLWTRVEQRRRVEQAVDQRGRVGDVSSTTPRSRLRDAVVGADRRCRAGPAPARWPSPRRRRGRRRPRRRAAPPAPGRSCRSAARARRRWRRGRTVGCRAASARRTGGCRRPPGRPRRAGRRPG